MMTRPRAILAAAALAALTLAGSSLARGPVFSAPPPGVSADEWHPISETLGLAVRYERDARGQRELVGTLMVREANRWQKVDVAPNPVGMMPAR